MIIILKLPDVYGNTMKILWKYYINNFPVNNASFKFKQKTTGKTWADGTKDAKIMMLLKYFSNFLRTIRMLLINCKINFILTWSANCIISSAAANQATTFAITDTIIYLPTLTLSTQNYNKTITTTETNF